MSRFAAAASVVLAGLLPVCAAALGLGEIQARSYLNQPLSADIPLISDTPGELAGLNVSLAPAETFDQYGLPRPGFLGDLTFSVTEGMQGPVIRVNSSQPVTEPFVTLLIEVRWPQGRLLREYTVLLDPPSLAGGPVGPAVQVPEAAPPAPAEPLPAAVPAPAAPMPSQAATAAPVETPADTGSHTVERNETLWGIARRYRPDSSVDLNQTMLAIYRANPQAFAGNMNRLKAGAVLRLPDRGAIGEISRREAMSEVSREEAAWRESRPRAGAAGTPALRLELVPPAETAEPTQAAGQGAEARSRPADAEASRRLLAVKDAELQALQDRVGELEREAAVPPAAEAESAPRAAAPPAATKAPAAPAAKPKPARPATPAAKPARDKESLTGTILGVLKSPVSWLVAAAVLVAGLLILRRRASPQESAPWQPPTMRGGDEETARGEDMIVIEEPGRPQAGMAHERRALSGADAELPLERTLSAETAVNLDQSDPLAEADFHMAYGLYDQAADLLTAAASKEPARRDLQLKLLDVYFVWENREGFLKQARALRTQIGDDNDPDWKRVVIMGKQLCPNEAMFAGAAMPSTEDMDLPLTGSTGAAVDLELGGGDGGLDLELGGGEGSLDFDLGDGAMASHTQEMATLESPAIAGAGRSASTMETPTIEVAHAGSRTMETPTIEVPPPDIGGTARIKGIAATSAAGPDRVEQTAEIDLDDLGLDLSGLDEAARDIATGLQESLPDGGVDLDLGDLARSSDSTVEMDGSPTLGKISNAIGKSGGRVPLADDTAEQLGISASMIEPVDSSARNDLAALDLGLAEAESELESDLTATGIKAIGGRRQEDPTMTEVGTKLDLARAYVDMGDPDGARSILNEVLEEGDSSQRLEARELLEKLAT